MPPPPSSPALLSAPLTTLTTLLQTFQTILSTPSHQNPIPNPPNALSLLHDASSLRAQTTKLSLLLLNKPFTPSAIATIITSISSECLPGLMSVWEICDGRRYSHILRSEIHLQLKDVESSLLGLVNQIPRDEMAVRGLEGKREEVLGATGQIWKTCDRMNKVAQIGIVGIAVEKVDGYHALVKDAVEELETWDPDEEEGSLFGSSSGSGASNDGVGKKVNGDVIGRAHQEQSESEPPALEGLQIKDMHAVKEGALKILKLIRMLYPALRKRRVSTFPPFDKTSALDAQASEDRTAVLDQLLRYLQGFSDETDEVAGALYGGDVKEVGRRLESLKKMAEGCVGEVRKGWKGEEDEFSAWSEKWVDRLKEAGS